MPFYEEKNIIFKKAIFTPHSNKDQRLFIPLNHNIPSNLCSVLNVNRSTFYKHFKPKSSLRKQQNLLLKKEILTIYSQSKKRFGVYKIRQRLLVQSGKNISVGRIYRLMKSIVFPKISTVKPSQTFIKSTLYEYKNILKQKFYPDKPNLIWVNDITYIRVNSRFFYVCVIIDLFVRKVHIKPALKFIHSSFQILFTVSILY